MFFLSPDLPQALPGQLQEHLLGCRPCPSQGQSELQPGAMLRPRLPLLSVFATESGGWTKRNYCFLSWVQFPSGRCDPIRKSDKQKNLAMTPAAVLKSRLTFRSLPPRPGAGPARASSATWSRPSSVLRSSVTHDSFPSDFQNGVEAAS